MSAEDWITRVGGLLAPEEIKEVLDDLKARNVNLVAEYGRGQTAAKGYLDKSEPIPSSLITALNLFANYDSGFTGLSVYEAYVEVIRVKK